MPGAARSNAFEALAFARKKEFSQASVLLDEAKAYSQKAHASHSELLTIYAAGELQGDLLISHAQDHLMCSELALELATEIIDLRKEIER